MAKSKAVICDFDETIANNGEVPNRAIINLIKDLSINNKILIVTAQPENEKDKILAFCATQGVAIDEVYTATKSMEGMNSDVMKATIWESQIKKRYDVQLVVDNKKSNCKIFTKLCGISSLQVRTP